MSIGVAIIGGGIFAREEHLPAVEACEHLTLRAVYSRSLKSAQSLKTDSSKVDLYSEDSGDEKSYSDLLARNDIHAVIIALPITTQPGYIREALKAGKHVLSEKPVAGTVQEAEELIQWYRGKIDNSKTIWAVAENFRFLNSASYGVEKATGLGRLLSFRVGIYSLLGGGKYYETEWRKTPQYQGGFLLDGGVHNIAITRQLLGKDTIEYVSAFTRQNQKHLPPIDTVDACVRTKNGATGTISISFGTTLKGSEYAAGFENGSVTVTSVNMSKVAEGQKPVRSKKVIVKKGEEEDTKDVEDEGTGVKPEVRAWAESIVKGQADARQSPEEALADLEILEAMFNSGEKNGASQQLKHQI